MRRALAVVIATSAALSSAAVFGGGAPAKTATAVAKPSAKRSVLPFVEDDYAAARADARARKVPLFIEAWAPW